jgi:hypothetical protein
VASVTRKSGKQYYYRSRREGDRFVREYVAFGDAARLAAERWRGGNSDWEHLTSIVAWVNECHAANMPDSIRDVTAEIGELKDVNELVDRLKTDLKPMFNEVNEIAGLVDLDVEEAFGTKDI